MVKPTPTRILAIDYGQARIGLAYSDERKIISMPLTTIAAEKKQELTAIKLFEELEKHQRSNNYTIEELIIGLPLMMNGSQGLLADEVKNFMEILRTKTSATVKGWDERLSSVQAERSLRESTMTRKKRTKHVDQVSATLILQSYLDSKGIF